MLTKDYHGHLLYVRVASISAVRSKGSGCELLLDGFWVWVSSSASDVIERMERAEGSDGP